jgi:hypothetical protein
MYDDAISPAAKSKTGCRLQLALRLLRPGSATPRQGPPGSPADSPRAHMHVSWAWARLVLLLTIHSRSWAQPSFLDTSKWSESKCDLGADGFIIALKQTSTQSSSKNNKNPGGLSALPAESFAAKVRAQWRDRRRSQSDRDGDNKILFTFSEGVFNGLAARLDDDSLKAVLNSPDVSGVSANCAIQLDKTEMVPLDAAEDRMLSKPSVWSRVLQRAGRAWSRTAKGDGGSQRLTGSQASAPWGLDRIDARHGVDGQYLYGNATGRGVKICELSARERHSNSTRVALRCGSDPPLSPKRSARARLQMFWTPAYVRPTPTLVAAPCRDIPLSARQALRRAATAVGTIKVLWAQSAVVTGRTALRRSQGCSMGSPRRRLSLLCRY